VHSTWEIYWLLARVLEENVWNKDKFESLEGILSIEQSLELINNSLDILFIELALLIEYGILSLIHKEAVGWLHLRHLIEFVNVRKLSNNESNLGCWSPFKVLDFIVKKRPCIDLALFDLLNKELSGRDHSILWWDDILEAPVHGIVVCSVDQRHPQVLSIESVRGVEISTYWV
jgi:hypothetical protein